MVCGEEMGHRLSKYVDNELTPEERRRVDEHLLGCPACKDLLAVFLRNERVVSQALSKETFGEAVIDGVMERIEEPPEAEPAEATAWERFTGFLRQRPWIHYAAAAMLAVALVTVVLASHSTKDAEFRDQVGRMQGTVRDLQRVLADSASSEQSRHESWVTRFDEIRRQLARERLANSVREIPGNPSAAAFLYAGVVVSGRFPNQDVAAPYSVWRSEDDGTTYRALRTDLADPVYEDNSIQPSKVYWYKFTARKGNQETVESVPVRLQPPPRDGMDPGKCLVIYCKEIGLNKNIATFAVTRPVGTLRLTHDFQVPLGKEVGGQVMTAYGPVDFSTGLKFEGVEEGDETLKVTWVCPKFDLNTKEPIYRSPGQQDFELVEKFLSIRPNKRAVLRHAGAPSGRTAVTVWVDGEALVPIRE